MAWGSWTVADKPLISAQNLSRHGWKVVQGPRLLAERPGKEAQEGPAEGQPQPHAPFLPPEDGRSFFLSSLISSH